jgi:hypothetical protein
VSGSVGSVESFTSEVMFNVQRFKAGKTLEFKTTQNMHFTAYYGGRTILHKMMFIPPTGALAHKPSK